MLQTEVEQGIYFPPPLACITLKIVSFHLKIGLTFRWPFLFFLFLFANWLLFLFVSCTGLSLPKASHNGLSSQFFLAFFL